jgi:hypothetical protein
MRSRLCSRITSDHLVIEISNDEKNVISSRQAPQGPTILSKHQESELTTSADGIPSRSSGHHMTGFGVNLGRLFSKPLEVEKTDSSLI